MIFSLLGLIIGFVAALLGLGGNIFIIPFLPLITEISVPDTIATGILTVCLISLMNSALFARNRMIDWGVAVKALPVVAFTGFLGGYLRSSVPEDIIRVGLILVLLAMMARLLFFSGQNFDLSDRWEKSVLLIASGMSGFMAGLVGIGNGVLLGPALLVFNLCDHKKISPTINFLIFINTFFATIGLSFEGPLINSRGGPVSLEIVGYLFLGAIVGSFLGRRLNQLVTTTQRKKMVAVVLFLVAVKLGFSY